MRYLAVVLVFFWVGLVNADDEDPPRTLGLDWSSDGQYIAVATSRGVHIHHSLDLSLFAVLDEVYVHTVKWSIHDLKLAYSADDDEQMVVWDLESRHRTVLPYPSESAVAGFSATSITWAPRDRMLAVGSRCGEIGIWGVEDQELQRVISIYPLYESGHAQIDWRPGGVDIMSGSIVNGIAVWNYYMGTLMDFMWNTDGSNSPARWSPDGSMIAAGDNPINVWKVKPDRRHTAWDELGGELVNRLDYELGSLFGLSWHPDSTKLAFVASNYQAAPLDFSRDGVLIWDMAVDETTLLPGVFIADMTLTDKVVEWSPDGSKLAAISSDGRIVISDTDTYEIIAEYAGYRSFLDYYAENP